MPINELRSIATFVNAAELGSLRKAAAMQGITPQAASQALLHLEKQLGVRLFHRTTRQLALTDEGRQFLEAAQPPLLGLQRALQIPRRAKDEIAGPLRIAGPRSSFRPLWRVVDAFRQRYPDVQPDVQLDDRLGNWVADRIDVGFRIGESAAEGVIARRLFPIQILICAAPRYVEQFGAPRALADLGAHRCIGFRDADTGRVVPWLVKENDAITRIDIVPALCTDSEEIELEAMLAGAGIGVVSSVNAADPIRAGRLVPVLTQHVADHMGMHVYYGSRAAQPARVRAFIDMAIELLANHDDYTLQPRELAAAAAVARRTRAPGRKRPPSKKAERA